MRRREKERSWPGEAAAAFPRSSRRADLVIIRKGGGGGRAPASFDCSACSIPVLDEWLGRKWLLLLLLLPLYLLLQLLLLLYSVVIIIVVCYSHCCYYLHYTPHLCPMLHTPHTAHLCLCSLSTHTLPTHRHHPRPPTYEHTYLPRA